MGREKKIDVAKAIEMKVFGKSLREIGDYFGTSGEAVRQALETAKKQQEQQKQWARMLVSSISPTQSMEIEEKKFDDSSKILDDWISVLQTIKKVPSLEAHIILLDDRIKNLEILLAKASVDSKPGTGSQASSDIPPVTKLLANDL
jgi:hypothetical protein